MSVSWAPIWSKSKPIKSIKRIVTRQQRFNVSKFRNKAPTSPIPYPISVPMLATATKASFNSLSSVLVLRECMQYSINYHLFDLLKKMKPMKRAWQYYVGKWADNSVVCTKSTPRYIDIFWSIWQDNFLTCKSTWNFSGFMCGLHLARR